MNGGEPKKIVAHIGGLQDALLGVFIRKRQELEELKELIPELGRLHNLRESLRAIFEDQRVRRPATAIARFQAWIAEARRTSLKALEAFCGTLERWMEEIANYFMSRSSNGRTEVFNHGLRRHPGSRGW